ncbi:MAG: hypothetical protein JJU11_13825 [Candidatus Sumerlaeia bacterium]|nr:hypothetical protein [Candidatus Sumerlaeia bacterium]
MTPNRPQNPVYPVDEKTYDVCLPKVACGHCGAILMVRLCKGSRRLRCCACNEMNEVFHLDGKWQARAAIPSPIEQTEPNS